MYRVTPPHHLSHPSPSCSPFLLPLPSAHLQTPLVLSFSTLSPTLFNKSSTTGHRSTFSKYLACHSLPSINSALRIARCSSSILDFSLATVAISPASMARATLNHALRDSSGSCSSIGATV